MTNPNTLLAAAKLAKPDLQIKWDDHNDMMLCYRAGYSGWMPFSFDPCSNPEDAYALWKALTERGFTIVPHRNRNRITYTWEKLGNKSLSGREFTINKSSVYGFGTDIEAMMAAVAALEAMK